MPATADGRRGLDLPLALALLGPAVLLGGALGFEHLARLPPCELCLWQRWPLVAALALALPASLLRPSAARRALLGLSGIAITASAAIALLHVGVEEHWWAGPTRCASTVIAEGGDFLGAILAAPLIRCDQAPWRLLGISLAGYNLLLSGLLGAAILWLTARNLRHGRHLDPGG